MKNLSSQAMGRPVKAILKCGQILTGECVLAGDSYIKIRYEDTYWDIDAEDIAAFGVHMGVGE